MKKTALLILALFSILGFNACNDDESLEFIARDGDGELTFTTDFLPMYFLSDQTADNIAERFVWDPADFEAPVNVTYELHGSLDNTFESFDPEENVVGVTSKTNIGVTVDQLLGFAEQLGLDDDPETTHEDGTPNNTGQVYFRLYAYTGTGETNAIEKYSEVQALNITVIEKAGDEEPPLRNLFFVGNSTPDNWNNNSNNTPLFRDPSNPDVYFYTGYFAAGEFKLLETKGQWQPQWGTNDGTTLSVNDGTGSDPGAFTVEEAGYYTLTVDIDNETFTLNAYDASGATDYGAIGFLGDATPGGWDADTDLTQSSFDDHIWYATGVSLSDGEMKFRANDAWDVNWGGNTAISGQGSFNGLNIPVTEGIYDIWFNDLTGRYILVLVE